MTMKIHVLKKSYAMLKCEYHSHPPEGMAQSPIQATAIPLTTWRRMRSITLTRNYTGHSQENYIQGRLNRLIILSAVMHWNLPPCIPPNM